jgi:hypothetical protein
MSDFLFDMLQDSACARQNLIVQLAAVQERRTDRDGLKHMGKVCQSKRMQRRQTDFCESKRGGSEFITKYSVSLTIEVGVDLQQKHTIQHPRITETNTIGDCHRPPPTARHRAS